MTTKRKYPKQFTELSGWRIYKKFRMYQKLAELDKPQPAHIRARHKFLADYFYWKLQCRQFGQAVKTKSSATSKMNKAAGHVRTSYKKLKQHQNLRLVHSA